MPVFYLVPLELWALISLSQEQRLRQSQRLCPVCLQFCDSWPMWGQGSLLTSPHPSPHLPAPTLLPNPCAIRASLMASTRPSIMSDGATT